MVTAKEITQLYLYGDDSTPANLVDDSLIRSSEPVTIEMDRVDFMTDGGGRFALPAQFNMIQMFFDTTLGSYTNSLSSGTYSKTDLATLWDLNEYDWDMQQYNFRDDHMPYGVDDYWERSYIYNSMSFMMTDNVQFVVNSNGTRHIDNLAIIPRTPSEQYPIENFDFEGGGLAALLNGEAEPVIDPSNIGRKVNFDWTGTVTEIDGYSISNFNADNNIIDDWAGLSLIKLYNEWETFKDDLWNEGVNKFLDDQDRPIIYGSSSTNTINALDSGDDEEFPTLVPYYANGSVLIGGDGNDNLNGGDYTDRLIGGEGIDNLSGGAQNDTLVGGDDNDTLTGGAGNDTLEGGDGTDNYVFSLNGHGLDTIIDSGVGNKIFFDDIDMAGTWTTNIATGGGFYTLGFLGHNTYYDYKFAYDGTKLYVYEKRIAPLGTPTTALDPNVDSITISEASLSSFGIILRGEYTGTSGDDTATGTQYADTMDGGNGNDTLNGGAGNDTIIGGGGNDTFTGGLGDDSMTGNTGSDVFNWAVGDGNDWISDSATGAGTDKVKITTSGLTISDFDVYGTVGRNVIIKHVASGETITVYKQFDNDTDYKMETLEFADTSTFNLNQGMNWKGTSGNDTLEAAIATLNDTMYGYEGNDTIDGWGGNDTIYGGDGNDTLLGNDGTDTINGGDGDDLINGGSGADAIDGGNGTDRVYFTGSTNGMTINLSTGTGSGNIAAGDTYTNIEDVSASNYADTITGDSNNNTIWGNDGNDTINGGGGNDTIYGGDNNDTIDGGAGADTIDGGTGTDNLTYANSSAGVNLNLTTNTNTGGDAQGDSISNIENIYATTYADVIIANSLNNFIFGDQGNDELRGEGGTDTIQGGTGADTMYGGSGNDTFKFTGIAESSSTNLDMIMDWVTGDKIALTGAGIAANFSGLSVATSGTGVLVSDVDSSFQIYVEGISSLSSTDFIF